MVARVALQPPAHCGGRESGVAPCCQVSKPYADGGTPAEPHQCLVSRAALALRSLAGGHTCITQ
eukprot:15485036-Alexandrium_andersonii.AAC.1